jgi:thioredoxin-related protein
LNLTDLQNRPEVDVRANAQPLLSRLLSLVAIALIAHTPAAAAPRPATEPVPKLNAELLVFEVEGCGYCNLFRRDVAPAYSRSPRARDVPMRFIDANRTDVSRLNLAEPLKVVPTIVLMVNGREAERITGYIGPEPFFHMISTLMRHE